MKKTNKDTNKHDVKAQQMNERFNLIGVLSTGDENNI